MIDDIQLETEPWLVEGMICPWLTLLSGQPKHGKTMLAGHIAIALINNQPPTREECQTRRTPDCLDGI